MTRGIRTSLIVSGFHPNRASGFRLVAISAVPKAVIQ
jgi:hypothetical protein